jgi:tetratricopeptide (TPR) repeat protein
MTRLGRLGLTLVLALAMTPALAEAQRGAQDAARSLRDANSAMARAMLTEDEAARRPFYQQVLQHSEVGLELEPGNAELWLLRGQAAAGLHQFELAHEALTRAVELNPEFAEEVESDREAAWIAAFNQGIDLMNEQRYEDAMAMLELATKLYDKRPEALMNLGSLYAHFDRYEDADRAFLRAVAAIDGPLSELLDEEDRASWERLRTLATINRAEIMGARGVTAYQQQNFREALGHFEQASEVNPHSRDYIYNVAQSLHALTAQLVEEKETASPERVAEIEAELPQLYARVLELGPRIEALDPNNELTWLLVAQANRNHSMLLPEAERGPYQQRALAALEKQQALPFAMDDIYVRPEGGAHVLTGHFKNLNLEPGAPLRLQFTVVGVDGQTLAEETVTIEAAEPGEILEFRLPLEVEGQIAGWRYRAVS